MEIRQRCAPAIEKRGNHTEQQKALGARVLGILALMSPIGSYKRTEMVNRNLNAAMNIRRYAVLETRPMDVMRANIAGHPLQLEVYTEKLKRTAGACRKKLGGVCELACIYIFRFKSSNSVLYDTGQSYTG